MQLVSMMTSICLRVMDARPKRRRRWVCSVIFAANRHRDLEQVGVQLQYRRLGRLQIDLESNRFVLKQKIDDSTLVQKLVRLADGQNGGSFKLLGKIAAASPLGCGHEQDVTSPHLQVGGDVPD